ncbi:MAG: hypothetical protein GEV00_21405 [Actinophytocola sp.]|nr:hypothetical protein [Actinophytocola sp.]
MPDIHVEQTALSGFAAKLRNASTDLENITSPPEVPEAGDATGILGSILSHLTQSMDGAVTGLGAAGDAVANGGDIFQNTEDTNRGSMDRVLPE